MPGSARLFWLLLLFGLSLPGRGETVRERMPSGLTAVADYRPGAAGKPAVLVLHGFLSTHHFATVRNIVETLADNGNPVLAPTLTLGIDARETSLPCDAIHTHTLEQDLAEIDHWIRWLAERHAGPVVLIGHSWGSLELLAWLAERGNPRVRLLIATSLAYAGSFNPPARIRRERRAARDARLKGALQPQRFHLSYCQGNFVAPPAAWLSYLRWDAVRVLAALREAPVPVTVIMGGQDRRFDRSWLQALRLSGASLHVIPGASHFFDAEHEFELGDAILQRVEGVTE